MAGRKHPLPSVRAPSHWQAIVALLVLAAIFGLVVRQLSDWLAGAIVVLVPVLLVSAILARQRKNDRLNRRLALALVALIVLVLLASVGLVIAQLVYAHLTVRFLGPQPSPPELLRNAALIWLSNVLVFAVSYWEIDAGGPAQRHRGPYHSDDVVFPQRQRDDAHADWTPDFLDYLFLSFNSSTAFSPTDTLVLSRRMKALMMIQSLISLAVLAVLAARAVNALA